LSTILQGFEPAPPTPRRNLPIYRILQLVWYCELSQAYPMRWYAARSNL
jgi:hypothetical protein